MIYGKKLRFANTFNCFLHIVYTNLLIGLYDAELNIACACFYEILI
ncbi:Uncharacterised protein [Sphingobacterium multivorum]|nr:Uncharacterised protein [Sphingobacterium multivorum]